MNPKQQDPEIRMNPADMWREEVFTDNAVGTLRRMIPVTSDGQADPARATRFMGSTQVMTNAGPLPLQFDIQASSLSEAVDGFGHAAKRAFEQTMQELREYQRQQTSSIVIPQGGLNSSGMGGGKLQLP